MSFLLFVQKLWREIQPGKPSPTSSKKSNVKHLCSKHQEKLTIWCKSCSKIVCLYCLDDEHDGHHFKGFDKAVKDIESDVKKKIRDFETNYEQDSVKLLEKKSEVEEAIHHLQKFEETIQLEKKKMKTILTQIIDQQMKVKERMENLPTMKAILNDNDRINRENMLIEYAERIISCYPYLGPITLDDRVG